jgi:hypothetical protein
MHRKIGDRLALGADRNHIAAGKRERRNDERRGGAT